MDQAADFRKESDALYALIKDLDADALERETQFKSWTINDVIAHLHVFNLSARKSLLDEDAFIESLKAIAQEMSKGVSLREYARAEMGDVWGPALRETWRDGVEAMAGAFGVADPSQRLKWFGPDLSARSSVTARLMETWAHGQAVFDLLGVDRVDHDRIKNIAVLGVKTYGWTFQNRGRTPPEPAPYLRLTAPSGAIWEFNNQHDDERIEGDATSFCQVVTQTRNVADTDLKVTGENANAWMAIAQCFAGAAVDPPAPGSRRKLS